MALADEEGGVGAALDGSGLCAGDIVILDSIRAGAGDDSGIQDNRKLCLFDPFGVRSICKDPGVRVFR